MQQLPVNDSAKIEMHENFVLILQLPQHKPVIIPLGQDSDESDSETVPDAKHSSSNSSISMGGFLGNLDQFLSNVRQDVEKQVCISFWFIYIHKSSFRF